MHIQQAIEKALKGYLLSRGWALRKIHNLVILLNDAVVHDPLLESHRGLCEAATEFYLIERYPDSPPSGLETEELAEYLAEAEAMVARLRQA